MSAGSTAGYKQTQTQLHCHLRPAVRAPAGGVELHAWQQQLLLHPRNRALHCCPAENCPPDIFVLHCSFTMAQKCRWCRWQSRRWWCKCTWAPNSINNVKAEQAGSGGGAIVLWHSMTQSSTLTSLVSLPHSNDTKGINILYYYYFSACCLHNTRVTAMNHAVSLNLVTLSLIALVLFIVVFPLF